MPVSFFELATFMALAVALAVVPGPNLAVVLRNAGRGGQRAANATALGLTLSKSIWAAASILGLASALNASASAYSILKIAGGAYLVLLGIMTLRNRSKFTDSATTDISPSPHGTPEATPTGSLAWAVRDGALSDVLNPKVGAFYLAVFPQYIEPGDNVIWAGLSLLLAHGIVLMTYYPILASLSLRLRGFGGRKTGNRIDGVIGAALVGTGSILIAESI